MKLQKTSLQNIAKAVIFLLILALLFLFFTYLFRSTTINTRENILHYYNMPEDSLDVVLIGASNVMRYWDPLRAWHSYGITSYNYAASGMISGTFFPALKDALKTQSPELVIVEARMFTKSEEEPYDYIRRLLDAYDFDFSRLRDVKYVCDVLEVPQKDRIPLYIDLIYYHTNYKSLINRNNWAMADNRVDFSTHTNLGYFPLANICHFEGPNPILSTESMPLDPHDEIFLRDILDYCKEEKIQLLLMASPLYCSEEESKKLNTVANLAAEYGVPFLNTNLNYDDISLAFNEDFSDEHHTNILGADKFTDFLAAYLDKNYELPDRRNDPDYAYWNEMYDNYLLSSNNLRADVVRKIEARDHALANIEAMKQADDLLAWMTLSDNSEFTLFILSANPVQNKPSAENVQLLKILDIDGEQLDTPFLIVYQNQFAIKNDELPFCGNIGEAYLPYVISTGEETKIEIDSINYADAGFEGIQIVVYSNSLDAVVDHADLVICSDGSIDIFHKQYGDE